MPTTAEKMRDLQRRYAETTPDKVFRSEFGPFPEHVLRVYENLPEILSTMETVAPYCHNGVQNRLIEIGTQLTNTFQQLSSANQRDYGANQAGWLQSINQTLHHNAGQALILEAPLLFAGLLAPKSIVALKSTAQEGVTSLNEVYKEIAGKAKQLIDAAESRAEQIEEQARQTARGISMQAAQTQFNEARRRIKKLSWFWGVAGAILTGGLIAIALLMYQQTSETASKAATQPSMAQSWPAMLSLLAVKLFVLSALAYVTTLCWRTFRAYLHMGELNAHRIRVANSIDAFMAASEASQDEILIRMMESVIAFGTSGLLPRDNDTIAAQRMSFIDPSFVTRSAQITE